jgi:hypothetical protein
VAIGLSFEKPRLVPELMVEKQTARVEAGTTAVSTVAKPIDGHWSPGPIETAGALSLSVWPTFLPAGRRGRTALLLLIVLAGWFFAVGLSHSRLTAVGRGDLAEYVNNPVRLLYGELPYRDFWLLHPPGEVLLPAAIYALGFGMDTVFLASLVINVLVGLAAFVIVRRLVRSNAEPVLAAAIVFFAGVPYTYNAYVSLQAYFLCLLVAAGFLFDYLRCHDRRSLFAASLAVGVGATFKFYLTGAAAAAMLAMVLLDAHRRRCRGQEMARLIAAFAAGAVLPLAAVALYFAELWPDFWYAIAMDSISHATVMRPTYGHKLLEMWADAVPVLRELRLHPFAWTSAGIVTLSRLIEMTTIHLIPFMAGGLWWYSRRKRIIPRHLAGRAVLFFLLWGGLTFIRGYVRGSGSSLVQSATPLYIVLVLLMRPLMAFARESQTSGARLAAACALLPLVGLGQWVATVTVHEATHGVPAIIRSQRSSIGSTRPSRKPRWGWSCMQSRHCTTASWSSSTTSPRSPVWGSILWMPS